MFEFIGLFFEGLFSPGGVITFLVGLLIGYFARE